MTSTRSPEDRAVLLSHLADLGKGLGADLDSGYWVRDVAVAGDGDLTGAVDLTTHARRLREPVISDVVGAGTDYPLPYTTRGQQRGLAPAPLGNVLSGRLRDVNAVTVDLDAAGLVRDGLRLEVGVDRPVTLRLLSGGRADTVALQPAGQG